MRFFLIIAILITPIVSFAVSQQPWYIRKLTLPESEACNTTIFDGAPKEYSRTYLNLYSDSPIFIVIYNGERFIRENVDARRRIIFNFINKDGFQIEICRQNFALLRKQQEQQTQIKAGARIPPEEVIPDLDSEDTKAINVRVSSN